MTLTIDLFGNELFEIRINEKPTQAATPPLGFTTQLEGDDQ